MAADEMFDSAVRMKGDLAGVFEYDGDVGYFYLYQTEGDKDRKVLGAIRIFVGDPDLQQADVDVRWNNVESVVGLFIEGQLWAAFDGNSGAKYGGDYRKDAPPQIPSEISEAF